MEVGGTCGIDDRISVGRPLRQFLVRPRRRTGGVVRELGGRRIRDLVGDDAIDPEGGNPQGSAAPEIEHDAVPLEPGVVNLEHATVDKDDQFGFCRRMPGHRGDENRGCEGNFEFRISDFEFLTHPLPKKGAMENPKSEIRNPQFHALGCFSS